MSDYLHPNGYTYSIEEVEMAAVSAGVDYDEFVKLKNFTPTNKVRTQLKLYNKKINYTADPNASYKNKYSGIQIDAETMKLTEGKAKDKLIEKLGGLGYKFEERDFNLPGVHYIAKKFFGKEYGAEYEKSTMGFDRLVAIAPDDTEQMFDFDNTLGAQSEADKLNEFVKNTINLKDINIDSYSQSWNYLDQRKNTEGKSFKNLSSEELQQEANTAYFELLNGKQRLPGVDKVYAEINTELEPIVEEKIEEIRQKYNLKETTSAEQYDLAMEELNSVVNAEHQRLLSESKEYTNIKVGIEKALEGKYGRTIEDQKRTEAENLVLPKWVTQFDSDVIRGLYTTSSIKLPKAWAEKRIMENGVHLKTLVSERDRIWSQIDQEKESLSTKNQFGYLFSSSEARQNNGKFTNQEALNRLDENIFKINKNLAQDFVVQQEYQKKLSDIRVPTVFGKDITDPDLTMDEWQNMLGDQIVQMVASIGTLGYSTYAQEGGGAGMEMVEITAAMKNYAAIPILSEDADFMELKPRQDAVNKAIDEVGQEVWDNMSEAEQNLRIEETIKKQLATQKEGGFYNYGNVSAEEFEQALKEFRQLSDEKRKELMLKVLNNGEIDLTPAMVVGLANAGLDFASTVVSFIPVAGGPLTGGALKGLKFAPKSLMRNIIGFNLKGTLKAAKPLVIASGTEVITETAQEAVSISGVGYATGYYGNKSDNIKRFLEAGSQAFLTTGPIVGGSAVVKSTIKDVKANYQAKNDPNHTRNSINNLKNGINNAFKNGNITLDEKLEFLDELEAEEDIINKYTEYKDMTVEQKTKVIVANMSNRSIEEQIAKLEAENAKLPQTYNYATELVNTQQIKNDIKIEDLRKKLLKNSLDIITELRIINDAKRSQFVEWINRNPDLVNGAKPKDLETIAEAVAYFDKVLIKLQKEGNLEQIQEFLKGVDKLTTGKANAFQFGKDVYSIKEMRHKLIRSNEGFGTSNAFHHDVLHVIQENMSNKELAAMQKEIVKQLGQTKDPELQKIFETAEEFFEDRYGKIKKDSKDYYLEWMANLSDTFSEYSLLNLTDESGISFTKLANFFSNTFHNKTKVGMDWGNFGAENALEHIKEYTNFYGQRKSLRIPTPKGKVEVDKEKSGKKKLRFSVAELNPINDLVPKDIKTLKDYQNFLIDRKAFIPLGKALQKNGIINNIIRKNTTPGTFQKTLDEVNDRILKFNPAAIREDGSVVGIEAFAERVFSDIGFGKKVAAKEIATKKPTISLDESTSSEGDRRLDIEDTDTDYVENIDYEKMESDFKRELGLNDELIEKSKVTARKTFGTKMPSLKDPRKYRKALKDAFVVELRDEVMKVFNTRETYNKFLKRYIPLFHRQISAERWVQIERLVPEDKKIFATKKRITSVKEVRKLQEQGLIRKDVKPASGPNLNTKLKTPSVEQIMAFFRGKNMQDILGYTVKESAFGTRKAGLGDAVIEKLASRAAISVLNNERAVAELRRDVEEISSIDQIENDVEVMAAIVDEDPNVRYSEVTSAQITQQFIDIKESIEINSFEGTFYTDPKSKKYKQPKTKSTNGVWLEQIYEPLYDLGRKGLFTDRQANQTIKKIYGSFKRKGENNLGDVTERIIFNLFKKVGFLVEGHLLGEKKVNIPAFYTFKGGKFQNADIMFELENGKKIALEIKFAADGTVNAGKIGVTSFNTKTGEFEYSSNNKDLSEDIKKITDEAVKGVIEVVKEIETLLVKKYGYPKNVSLNDVEFIHDPETLIARSPYNQKEIYRIDQSNGKTKWYQNDPKKGETGPDLKSLKAKSNIKVKDDGTVATYHYNKKGNFYILFVGEGTGKGMYYMGADPLETSKNLGTKRLKSNKEGFVFRGRLLSGSVTKVKDGVKTKIGYKLRISGESVINTNNMAETSAFNIRGEKDVKTFQKAVNSSIEAKTKVKSPISEAVKKYRGSKVVKGITVLDFDDTLATSKSLVRYTKPDGSKGTLTPEEYASTYQDLLGLGYVFDFSEFNRVVDGKVAPLFNKALKLQKKFGNNDMFVLTARPAESAEAIFAFYKS